MSYVKEVLQSGERVLYQARISLWNFFVLYVAIVVLLLAMIGANNAGSTMGIVYILLVIAYFIIRILITYYGTELVLTDSRLIYKRGFISRYTSEMNYKKIESIHVAQSILGRLLNYGTIRISGVGSDDILIRGIAAPIAFRKKFSDLTDEPAESQSASAWRS